MTVDWSALGVVFAVSLGVVLGVVVLFSLGVRGLSARGAARELGGSATVPTVVAWSCFAACAAVVGFGIYLVVAG
jgi:hypothetical protein